MTDPVLHIIHQQDDSLDQSLSTMSVSMSGTNVYEAARLSGGSSIMENLQSQLKLREGEIVQLQVGILINILHLTPQKDSSYASFTCAFPRVECLLVMQKQDLANGTLTTDMLNLFKHFMKILLFPFLA